MSAGNYRPVSLTCIVCKIMESIIRDDIVNHLNRNMLIRTSQHGFMFSKSCQTNLIEYLDTLTKLVEAGHSVDIIYLDFAKAFDKVPHQRLLLKLQSHGVTGKLLAWISAWLTGRVQRVVLNGEASEWVPVTSGVPQGSVLGPICFVVFINDLDEVVDLVHGFIYKFADDTKYGRIISNDEDRAALQRDIDKLLEWAEKWQMDFNAVKCKVLHVGRKNEGFNYTMGGYAPAGTILEAVDKEKDIGVIIHKSLKPTSQCTKAAATANSILGQMSKTVHYRDKKVWIGLYKTFVRPHLECSVQAWSPWLKADIETLEKVQMRAVNMVLGLRGKSYEEKLKEVRLLSLYDRRVRGDAILVWKVLHGHCAMDPSLFPLAGEQHSRLTRHTAKPLNLKKKAARLDVRKNSFCVRCVGGWNSLPDRVQRLEEINDFKNEYDNLN